MLRRIGSGSSARSGWPAAHRNFPAPSKRESEEAQDPRSPGIRRAENSFEPISRAHEGLAILCTWAGTRRRAIYIRDGMAATCRRRSRLGPSRLRGHHPPRPSFSRGSPIDDDELVRIALRSPRDGHSCSQEVEHRDIKPQTSSSRKASRNRRIRLVAPLTKLDSVVGTEGYIRPKVRGPGGGRYRPGPGLSERLPKRAIVLALLKKRLLDIRRG